MKHYPTLGFGIALVLASTLATAEPTAEPAAEPAADRATDGFAVFDALMHTGKPASEQLGLRRIKVVYGGSLWRPGRSNDEPDEVQVRWQARRLGRGLREKPLVCIDIEHWRLSGPETDRSIEKMQSVIRWMREEEPSLRYGFYSALPIRDYWRATKHFGRKKYDDWIDENRRLKRLGEQVDVVFPSLYTFYDDPDGWEAYATANLEQARQYGKPVYAFLWPAYHVSNESLAGQPIPADYWRRQLDLCREHADGIVLWGGYQRYWKIDAPWWRETARFLETLREHGHGATHNEK